MSKLKRLILRTWGRDAESRWDMAAQIEATIRMCIEGLQSTEVSELSLRRTEKGWQTTVIPGHNPNG